MMRWRFALPLLLFGALAVFLAVGLRLDPKEVPSPLIDRPAPAFRLDLLHDANRRLGREDLLGQVWMLNVWASWCVACQQEHPVLMDFARQQLLPVYGLDYKDQRDAGLRWLARHGNPYTESLFDPDGRVGIDWGVYGVPETFIVDRDGIVRFKHIGPLTPEVIRERIEPLVRRLRG